MLIKEDDMFNSKKSFRQFIFALDMTFKKKKLNGRQ